MGTGLWLMPRVFHRMFRRCVIWYWSGTSMRASSANCASAAGGQYSSEPPRLASEASMMTVCQLSHLR